MTERLSLYVLGLFIYVLGVVLLGESLPSFPDSKLRDCLSSLLGAQHQPCTPHSSGLSTNSDGAEQCGGVALHREPACKAT